MRVLRSLAETLDAASGSVIAVGFFDGVHRGHQHLLRNVVERADAGRMLSMALTFEDHPARLFHPEQCPGWLMDTDEKIAALEPLGLDVAVVIPFDWSTAGQTAEQFSSGCLVGMLKMRRLVCGPDFALGRGRQGTVPVLRDLGARLGFEVCVVEPVVTDDEVISSTRIRDLICEGDVATAAVLLGRPFVLSGQVVRGRGLGRQIGVPTINLQPDPRLTLPACGVYAGRTNIAGSARPAVANVGHRPTVGGGALTIELHVIAGEVPSPPARARLELVTRLRAERKFDSVEQLKQQIERDIARAREVL